MYLFLSSRIRNSNLLKYRKKTYQFKNLVVKRKPLELNTFRYKFITNEANKSNTVYYKELFVRALKYANNFANKSDLMYKYRPGLVMINPEDWTNDVKNTIVQYRYEDMLEVGLLLRPKGKRFWIIQGEDGLERQISKYDIVFQWPNPIYDEDLKIRYEYPTNRNTTETLQNLKNDVKEYLSKIPPESAEIIWEVYYPISLEKDKKSVPIDLYSLSISLFNEEIPSDIQIYATYKFLELHTEKFKFYSRGFYCMSIQNVAMNIYEQVLNREEEKNRMLFLDKIKRKLESQKSLQKLFDPNLSKTSVKAYSSNIDELHEDNIEFNEFDLNYIRQLKDFALCSEDDSYKDLYEEILKPLGYGDKPHHAFNLLVDLGLYDPLDNPHILRWPYDQTFTQKEEQMAQKIIENHREIDFNGRVDLTGHAVFCIDDINPDEVDDGLSIIVDEDNNEWIYVHFADVSHYVEPNSLLDNTARERATSIHLPDRTFGMFPKILSDFISLQPGKKQYALSFGFILDIHGNVEKYKIVKSVIDNVHRLTYKEVDQVLNSKHEIGLNKKLTQLKKFYYDILVKLADYASRRRSHRLDHNAIIAFLPNPDVKVQFDNTGQAVAHVGSSSNYYKNSRGIVTEFMLLAGELAAKFCSEKDLPIYYKSQERKPIDKIITIDSSEKKPYIMDINDSDDYLENLNMLSALKSQVTSNIPGKHHGYGLSKFTNVSSPLRRYFDLVVHYQISSALKKEKPTFSEAQVATIMNHILARSEEVKELQNKCRRFWVLGCIEEIVKQTPSRIFKAIVTSPKSFLSSENKVLLLEFGLTVEILPLRNYYKGERIKLIVDSVNPFYDTLIMREKLKDNADISRRK